jgi:hypothetical protein
MLDVLKLVRASKKVLACLCVSTNSGLSETPSRDWCLEAWKLV